MKEVGTQRTVLRTLLAPVSWGTTYVVISEMLPTGRPLLLAAVRVVPAGVLLAALGYLTSRWLPRRQDWTSLWLRSLFNFTLFFPLLTVAVYRLPGGVAAAVGGLQPLFVAGLTRAMGGERPRPTQILVGIVGALGVAMVVLRPDAGFDLVGIGAAVAANLSFATGVVLTKRNPISVTRLGATGWELLVAGVVLVPLAFAVEGAPPVFTLGNLLGFAYLSLVATGVAFVLWFAGVARLPVSSPPLLGLAAPTTGVIVGWLVLGQDLTLLQISGFGLVVTAIAFGAFARSDGPETDQPVLPVATKANSAVTPCAVPSCRSPTQDVA